MIYPNNYESKVRFDKIREMLKDTCLCTLGCERVDDMKFSDNENVIKNSLKQVTEFVQIITEDEFPENHFIDLRSPLKKLRIQNTFLDEKELFDLQRSLQTILDINSFLNKSTHDDKETGQNEYIYPVLQKLTTDIKTFPHIIRSITQIIDKYGNIKDNASPELFKIRNEISRSQIQISHSLQSILNNAKKDGLINKDVSPTIREGRLMIPVSPALKRKIKGIVHDESDSGKTVFIEPAEVVEANNKIRELEANEKREIMRILHEMSDAIRPEAQDMLFSYNLLADVDFIRAKAKFAISTDSCEPLIENRQIIDWGHAVHPLLQISLSKHGKKVVPLDVELNSKQRIMIISGPNAGGKSVCLKTVGLLQYMMQCGMLVPMNKTSRMGIFKSIFIDIGDDQSIENDLSTYSSHLMNMKNIMKFCDGKSLVLIDEFGSGTEPQIGGAMAEAVLKRINSKKTFGVITTHYQNLKLMANETEGIINGAMLYDRKEMQPLFLLQAGNPGSSFAVEIARKIGIPNDVIQDASDIVGKEYINADKYLQDIVRDRRYWESKRDAIHTHEKQLQKTIERYENEIKQLKEEKTKIINEAKNKALEMIKESNAKIELTIKEIKESQAEKAKTMAARQELNEFRKELNDINPSEMEGRINRQMEKLKARQERKNKEKEKKLQNKKNAPAGENKPIDNRIILKVGDYAKIKGQNSVGQIVKINGNDALLTFGMVNINVDINKLQKAEKPAQESSKRADTGLSRQTQDAIRERTLNFKQEIDVRGMRADEALQAVMYFIDDALVAGVSRVRILHGTGGGVLRTIIRQYLSSAPGVADFRDEHIQFGGAGITVVDLI